MSIEKNLELKKFSNLGVEPRILRAGGGSCDHQAISTRQFCVWKLLYLNTLLLKHKYEFIYILWSTYTLPLIQNRASSLRDIYSFSKVVWISSSSLQTRYDLKPGKNHLLLLRFSSNLVHISNYKRPTNPVIFIEFYANLKELHPIFARFFQNFLSRLPNTALTLSLWKFYQTFEYY